MAPSAALGAIATSLVGPVLNCTSVVTAPEERAEWGTGGHVAALEQERLVLVGAGRPAPP
jgi:hypothetical protein